MQRPFRERISTLARRLRRLTVAPIFFGALQADDPPLRADFSVPRGAIRALHGINKGPLAPGGMFDVIEEQKELGIPFTRLHDCGWPNPYVVDHHAVFPNPERGPVAAGELRFSADG